MTAISTQTYSDPDEFSHGVRAAHIEGLVFANPKGFRADLVRVSLERLWLQTGRESAPRSAHLTIASDRSPIFFLTDERQPTIQQSGVDVSAAEIVFFGRGASHFQRAPSALRWATMSLSHDDLAASSIALLGKELGASATSRIIRPSRHLLAKLRGLHDAARKVFGNAAETLPHSEVARSIEQSTIEALVACLASGDEIPTSRRALNHTAVMARFENWLEINLGKPVYLVDACAAVGVSERTLRICCQEHLGVSPNRYLWIRRMHLAHGALRRASMIATTVSSIATSFGFWELGRFAVEYRKLFGEMPRATLARSLARHRTWPGRRSLVSRGRSRGI